VAQSRGWLLTLDNVEDPAHIRELLAQVSPHGHLVITTRRDIVWKGVARPLSLNVLTPQASVQLLATLTGRDELATARELGACPGRVTVPRKGV
jgi:hypothetical protein